MDILSDLSKAGIAGVAIGLIIAIVLITRAFLASYKEKDKSFIKVVTNHLKHNTRSNQKMVLTLEYLIRVLKKNDKG